MRKILSIIIICFCVTICEAQSNLFHAKYLESTAKILKLEGLDTMSVGYNVVQHNGNQIIVIKNNDSTITHIGRLIFAPNLRKEHPSPIYNYLEYALLDNICHFTDNPFVYKDIQFVQGGWKDFVSINDTTAFGIEVYQNKLYVVKWYVNDSKTVEMMFPINYERLSLVNRKELEQNIIRDIKKYAFTQKDSLSASLASLKHIDSDVWVKEGRIYVTSEINENIYFVATDSIHAELINTKDRPAESVANWCIVGDVMGNNCMVDVTFIKYDYTQETVTVPMSSFIAYMKHEGCVPYWGWESTESANIEGSLFLNNKEKGYDHVLKIEANTEEWSDGVSKIRATAYLLSPITNIKDLHYNYSRKPKQIEIIK